MEAEAVSRLRNLLEEVELFMFHWSLRDTMLEKLWKSKTHPLPNDIYIWIDLAEPHHICMCFWVFLFYQIAIGKG